MQRACTHRYEYPVSDSDTRQHRNILFQNCFWLSHAHIYPAISQCSCEMMPVWASGLDQLSKQRQTQANNTPITSRWVVNQLSATPCRCTLATLFDGLILLNSKCSLEAELNSNRRLPKTTCIMDCIKRPRIRMCIYGCMYIWSSNMSAQCILDAFQNRLPSLLAPWSRSTYTVSSVRGVHCGGALATSKICFRFMSELRV